MEYIYLDFFITLFFLFLLFLYFFYGYNLSSKFILNIVFNNFMEK